MVADDWICEFLPGASRGSSDGQIACNAIGLRPQTRPNTTAQFTMLGAIPSGAGILDHVAGVEDVFLAKATYDAACKRWPGKMIILRTGALVLEESRKTPLREDANATYSESGLPKCNARHRRRRRAGTRCSSSQRVHHGAGVCRFARKRPNAVRYGSCGRHLRRSFVWRLSRKGKRIGEMPGWAGQQANWCKLVGVHSGAAGGAA